MAVIEPPISIFVPNSKFAGQMVSKKITYQTAGHRSASISDPLFCSIIARNTIKKFDTILVSFGFKLPFIFQYK